MRMDALKIYWILGSLVVAVASWLANPDHLLYGRHKKKLITRPPFSKAQKFKDLNSNCLPVAQYRNNPERTGLDLSTTLVPQKIEIQQHWTPLNVDIHSASKSSPIVDSTGIYVGSDGGWLIKYSFQGEVLWKFAVPTAGNGIHGSVAVDQNKVYIGAYNGFLYALDKKNGDLVWQKSVGDFVGASPLLAGGHLYISAETRRPDGLLVKLDCNSGESIWTSEWLGGHSHSSVAYHKESKSLLVGANSGRFFSFDEDTGKTNWQIETGGQLKGTPMLWKNRVYFGSWDKHYYAYDIRSGEQIWKQFMGGRIQTSLTPVPGHNTGVTNTKVGQIVGLNLETGEILWRLKHGDSNHQFSILVTKNPEKEKGYLAWSRCKRFQLCVLDATDGQLLRNILLPGSFTSVPYAFDNKLYISLDREDGFIVLGQ